MPSKPTSLTKFLCILVGIIMSFQVVAQETKKDSITIINGHYAKASEAILIQDFDKAIKEINSANNIATLLDDKIVKAKALMELAQLNYFLRNYVRAEEDASIAIKTYKKEGVTRNKLGQAYTVYGLILTRLKRYNDSESYLKKADVIFTELNKEVERANVLLGLGILEYEKDNFQTAVNYFDAAIPTFNANNLKFQEAFSLLNKAETLIHLDNSVSENLLRNASLSYSRAKEIIENKNYTSLDITSHRVQGKLALSQGKSELAANQFNTYLKLNDSLNQVYIAAISKGANSDANIASLTSKIAEQQSNLEKQQKSIDFAKMTAGLSVALIIILSLLTLSLYKNNNLRAKANGLLQDKNDELILAKEKAEKASIAKAQFLSTITHELRTPLYAVTGLFDILEGFLQVISV